MEIYLYWSKIAPLSPRELEEQMQYLPSEKRQRLQRMHSKERMLASLWAERLLRYGLWRQYGRKAEGMERDVTSQGKPFFADGKIHFSLSHSGAYALAALSRQTVGADIQEVREVDMASIARRVFALREYEAWRTVQEETVRKQLFYQIWTCRESEGKRQGCGLCRALPSCILPDGSLDSRYFYDRKGNIFIAASAAAEADFVLQYIDLTKIQ